MYYKYISRHSFSHDLSNIGRSIKGSLNLNPTSIYNFALMFASLSPTHYTRGGQSSWIFDKHMSHRKYLSKAMQNFC